MREDGDQRLQSRQRKHNFFTEELRVSAIVWLTYFDNEVDWGSVTFALEHAQ